MNRIKFRESEFSIQKLETSHPAHPKNRANPGSDKTTFP
jgi:hypothetical protein